MNFYLKITFLIYIKILNRWLNITTTAADTLLYAKYPLSFPNSIYSAIVSHGGRSAQIASLDVSGTINVGAITITSGNNSNYIIAIGS